MGSLHWGLLLGVGGLLGGSAAHAQAPVRPTFAARNAGSFPDTAARACPTPVVDTTDWQLTGTHVAKVQLRLPPAYALVLSTDESRDSSEVWRRSEPFGWIRLRVGGVGPTSAFTFGTGGGRAATQLELDSMREVAESRMGQRPVRCETEADSLAHARAGISVTCGHAPAQLTSCRETISGQSVWVASGRDTGWAFGAFTAWATWRYAPHVWITVSMLADSRDEQLTQLRVLRTVRLH